MNPERSIRESDLAELIGMALHLQENASAASEGQLSEREVLQIGEHIGIPSPVMDEALKSFRGLRRDWFRSSLGNYLRDELSKRLQDARLRELYSLAGEARQRVEQREALIRRLKKEMGFFELVNPFSSGPGRMALELERESLRNEQRQLEHAEKRLRERIEELLESVAPLSVLFRAEKIERLLGKLGVYRMTAIGSTIQEALSELDSMKHSVTDAFGFVPEKAELVRMVREALPEVYGDDAKS